MTSCCFGPGLSRPFLFEWYMKTDWRLIKSEALTGAENMAQDEALLESVVNGSSLPVLRLYRWSPATVTLGYGQRGSDVVNLSACKELGLDVVRRCTGGRAVLHDHEMTYAVMSHDQSSVFPGGVLNNYQVIARVLQQTLAQIGLDVQLSMERSHGLEGGGAERSACFTAPGQFELVYQGHKLAGCAQKRYGGSFLHHGSVPLVIDLVQLFQALNTRPGLDPSTGANLLMRHVGWLNRWLSVPVTLEQLETAFIETCADLLQVDFIDDQLTAAEQLRVSELCELRYANPEWNQLGLC